MSQKGAVVGLGDNRGPNDPLTSSRSASGEPSAVTVHHAEPTCELDDGKVYRVVVMKFSFKYLKSMPGILKILQVLFTLISLLFLTTADSVFAGYLLLPLDWHLRVFVFVIVFSLLFSLASFIVHVYSITESLRISWKKFDFIAYALLSFLLLFAASMVASAIGYYDSLENFHIQKYTRRHLVIATILGYVSMVLYALSAYYAGWQWQSFIQQFDPQLLTSSGSTVSTSQPNTPTAETGGPVRSIVV